MHTPLLALLAGGALLGASAGGMVLAEGGISTGGPRHQTQTGVSTGTPEATETPVTFKPVEGSGGNNIVQAKNEKDGSFELRGRVDFGQAKGDRVGPSNVALAYSSCRDCQTLAIALQLVVYQQGATAVFPANAAVATNAGCIRCLTIARAVQYVIPVDDLDNVPREVRDLAHDLDKEMNDLEAIRSLQQTTPQEVETRLNSIITRFDSLRAYLEDRRTEETSDNSTPTPAPTTATTATPVLTATPLPTATATPTPAAQPSPQVTAAPVTSTP
jgi:hypothetical protein